MKKSLVCGVLLPWLWITSIAAAQSQPQSCQASSGKFVVPVVELYTSEGCSSCPPADRWLSKQILRNDINANFISFHVDYWDDIGWPDKFASASYSQRQRERVRRKGSTTVYTPQVMIGEQTGVTWYRPEQLEKTLKQANAQVAIANIRLQAKGADSQWRAQVTITSPQALPHMQWYLATYQDGLSSNVTAGENNGVLLKHDRVIRQWLGPYRINSNTNDKVFDIRLPKASLPQQTSLLAILENATTGQVLQSLKLPLSQCR